MIAKPIPDSRSIVDHGPYSAYCKVCWFPVYSLWADEAPHGGACINGKTAAHDCGEALARTHLSAELAKLRDRGLLAMSAWPDWLHEANRVALLDRIAAEEET